MIANQHPMIETGDVFAPAGLPQGKTGPGLNRKYEDINYKNPSPEGSPGLFPSLKGKEGSPGLFPSLKGNSPMGAGIFMRMKSFPEPEVEMTPVFAARAAPSPMTVPASPSAGLWKAAWQKAPFPFMLDEPPATPRVMVPKDGILDAAGSWLGDAGARELAATIAESNVTALNLAKNSIGDYGMEALAQAIPGSTVTSLNLGANEISDRGAKVLAKMIQQTPSLCSLHLGGNMIGADGAADIAAAAALSPWLTVLDLGNNPIGAEGAEAVAQIVNAQMLTELDLRGDYAGLNTIGAAGAEASPSTGAGAVG
jgi:hypothetical protein